jgi:hypothetical protein
MVKNGEIPAIAIRQQWRFDWNEIDAWLKTCTVKRASEEKTKSRTDSAVAKFLRKGA